jgi:phasin family protein
MADRKAQAKAPKAAAAKAAQPKPRPHAVKAAPAAAEQARETIEASEIVANKLSKETITMTNETIEQVQETQRVAADRFQAAFSDVNERSRDAMQRSARIVEEMTDLARGNVEAFVASSKVAARGVEQLSQEAAEFGRRSFEQASATFRSFSEVRSPADLFRLQSDFARQAFDGLVAESSKVSETVLKLAGEVAEPITSRYAVAAERVKNVAA